MTETLPDFSTRLPLRGTVVVDLTRNVAGPYAAMILAELGADVIKVEHPVTGDDARKWGPPFWGTESTMFLALNRNKRSLVLDLKMPEARDVLSRLALRADVFIDSFRPMSMERLGFGFEWASGLNPRLIYCKLSGYGSRGPMGDRPGYDSLVQAFAGIMSVTGQVGGQPARVGTSIVDMGSGMWAAISVLTALLRRQETGKGSLIAISLYEVGLAWMSYHLAGYWASGEAPRAYGSSLPTIVPYQAFPSRNGHVMIAAPNDSMFVKLCGLLGQAALAHDRRFLHNSDRVRNRDLLVSALSELTRARTTSELLSLLESADMPCSPIRDTEEVAHDEQAAALGIFQTGAHPTVGSYTSVGLPFELDGQRPPLRRYPPLRGEHSSEILTELSFSPEEIVKLLNPIGGSHREDSFPTD